eukprot:Hpha_TRINITY_DN3849_c0_g1::TRINITY_DN3849_c0_g1_i1::g.44665::m.44665
MGKDGVPVCVLIGPSREEPLRNCDPTLASKLEAAGLVPLTLTEAEKRAKEGKGVRGALLGGHAGLGKTELDRIGGQLRVVSNYGVGVDHINVQECVARSVRVGHTPDVLSEAVADCAWALLFAVARRIGEADHYTRTSPDTRFPNLCFLGTSVHGTTLGIVGMGRIGERIAQTAKVGFGMKVLYHNRSRKPDAERGIGAEYRSLLGLCKEADHIVIVCPLTPETKGLIGREALSVMKPTATLVNIARGGVVDTDALVEALRGGRIFGAGLDVTDPEPLPPAHPLREMRERVVLMPHRGSATAHARGAMLDLTVRNLVSGLREDAMPAELPATRGLRSRL